MQQNICQRFVCMLFPVQENVTKGVQSDINLRAWEGIAQWLERSSPTSVAGFASGPVPYVG